MLKLKNLSFAYGSIQTLNSVDMEMETGKVTCILGRNGVGKTTLLKNIMGILKPFSKSVIQIDEVKLTTMAPHLRAKMGLGYVPQGRQIFPRITVEENLKVALQARRDRIRVIPDFVYDLFPVLREMGGRMGGDLSGGQQQRLTIARALSQNPELLLLDEFSIAVDPVTTMRIEDVLKELKQEVTIILVTNLVQQARRLADRTAFFLSGELIEVGETEDLFNGKVEDQRTLDYLEGRFG